MDEIGKNLKYSKFELHDLSSSILEIKNDSQQIQQIDIDQIKKIEITGVISGSGFCGTMEWGMSNQTFMLATNFLYNFINFFKRKKDRVYIKVVLEGGEVFIVVGSRNHFIKLQRFIK